PFPTPRRSCSPRSDAEAIQAVDERPTRGCAGQATGHLVRGSNPSSGPRRLVRAPVAVHLLPSEKGGNIAGRASVRAKNNFPLRGEYAWPLRQWGGSSLGSPFRIRV